ncbi:PBP1A family penicillin-binding protein [Bacillus sp. ISL-51]|uniref:PBP1A family penicillin-binding protein n=1 Tax=Bacteria TaxID=2 RepID=UPI001BE5AFA9|nr:MULTISPECIES: PBP1A family penicillin-binding protein [Bacteria]MBT2575425.1 PBP1A family penicillin-binding protein [Bacillus sp. ISL-51]MBT2713062.1 PBP1A family penicillin-binding protein [Pseudomonas sp. ISL-88]
MSDQFMSREERRKAKQTKNSKPASSPKKGKKQRKGGLFKKIVLSLVILFVLGIVGGAAAFAVLVSGAPSLDEAKLKTPYSSTIYDKNGKEIAEVGAEKRTYVPIKDIPDVVKEAFIATEDARFYKHHGIDPIRIGGALVANFTDGFGSEGGSTITQQVVKNSLLTHQKTIKRKAQEVWLSLQLERHYSKDEILEMYLNRIYFSPRAYGVGKAAEEFFGVKDLSKLTVEQAATLAGMPQSPTGYNPVKNPNSSEKRRNIVLSLMEKQGFISSAEYQKAKKVSMKDEGVVSQKQYEKKDTNKYSAFVEEVMSEIETKEKKDVDISTDGLKIYTTLDTKAQDYLDELMDGDSVGFTQGMQGGVTLLDTTNGEIRAIGSGRNSTVGGYNYATQAKRQPGSTIKPILDYGPVIENKKWSTYEQIDDSAYSYTNGTAIHDWDRKYLGPISMRYALAQSRNIPALKAYQAAGKDNAVDFANGLGLGLNKDSVTESYSIGGFGDDNPGVSTLTMAGAYSAFGNNGTYNEPHAVTSIEFNDGTKLDLTPKSKSAMSDYTAFMITDMLKSAVQTGTGSLAQVPNVEVAGKTGTTNFPDSYMREHNIASGGVPDSWFVGYTPQYTAAVWTGVESKNKAGKLSLSKADQQVAKRLFQKLISYVDDGKGSFEQPDSVVKETIEKGSNPAALAGPNTPDDKKVTEYFVKGTQPTAVSKTYTKEKADKPTGLQVKYDKDKKSLTLSWDYDGDASFNVKQSVDGGSYSDTQNSSAKEAVVSDVTPGSTYSFQVTAENDDGKSDTVSTSFKVPKDEEDDADKDKKTDEENPDDNQDKDKTQTDDSQTDNNQTDPSNGSDDSSTDDPTKNPDQPNQDQTDNGDKNQPGNGKDKNGQNDNSSDNSSDSGTDGSNSDDKQTDKNQDSSSNINGQSNSSTIQSNSAN